jgi:WD40 repeat protein
MHIIHTPGLAILWNTKDWTVSTRFQDDFFNDIAWHPMGHLVATSSRRRVTLWKAATGQPLRKFLEADEIDDRMDYDGLAFSPNGQSLAVCSERGFRNADVLILDSHSGEVVHRLIKEEDGRAVFLVRFLPDGKQIVGLSYDYDYIDRAYLWHAMDGTHLTTFDLYKCFDNFEPRLEVSPTGRFLATNGDAQLWELEAKSKYSWHLQHTCEAHAYGVWHVEFSPDERILATMGAEALEFEGDDTTAFSVRLWDVVSGKERAKCAIIGKCYCIGISPDGHLLATMSAEVKNYFLDDASEYLLTLWGIPSGQILARLTTGNQKTKLLDHLFHQRKNLLFSPDGRWLAVSFLEHVEVWDIGKILGS